MPSKKMPTAHAGQDAAARATKSFGRYAAVFPKKHPYLGAAGALVLGLMAGGVGKVPANQVPAATAVAPVTSTVTTTITAPAAAAETVTVTPQPADPSAMAMVAPAATVTTTVTAPPLPAPTVTVTAPAPAPATVTTTVTSTANPAGFAQLPKATATKTTTKTVTKSTTSKPKSSSLDPHFGTCAEAKAHGYGHYRAGVDPEYDWYRDADGDGVVCE